MRIVNKDLLKSYQGKKCLVCENTTTTVAHHIRTRGAMGDDVESNLFCLCWWHHRKIHDNGLIWFVCEYNLNNVMKEKGWTFDNVSRKWTREK